MKRNIRAGDAKSWHICHRKAWYDHFTPVGFEVVDDPFENLLKQFGKRHEQAIMGSFEKVSKAESPEHTQKLISDGVPVIYQPEFIDTSIGLIGRPDFLIKSKNGEYQVADAKYVSNLKKHPEIQIQIGLFRKLARTYLPAIVYMNSGEIGEVGDEINEKCEQFIISMKTILAMDKPPNVYFSESKCSSCPFDHLCRPVFVSEGEITLTYGVDSRSVDGLKSQGIKTISDLANAEASKIDDVPYIKGEEKKRNIIFQAKSQLSGDIYSISPIEFRLGTWIHFDIEDNPLSEEYETEVYLWGFLKPPYGEDDYEYIWKGSNDENDENTWIKFLETVEHYRGTFPDLVLVHYSHHENTQIKKYAERYNMKDNPTVAWLLGVQSPLYDIQKLLKACFILPVLGYGLKAICTDKGLVDFQWGLEESGSQWSVVRYNDLLVEEDIEEQEKIKDEILRYNKDDVLAMRALEIWLRTLS